MYRVRICMEVEGLSKDEQGNPAPAGLELDLGESKGEIPYEELTEGLNIPALLKVTFLDRFAKPEDVRIITPEDYDERYGDQDEQ